MSIAPEVKQIGVRIALLAALALPMYAGFAVPSSEWGPGTGEVDTDVPNYSGPSTCYVGYGTYPGTCTESIASNFPVQNFVAANGVGTSYGTLSASTDVNGVHLFESASGSGNSEENVSGDSGFFDTAVNNTSNPVQLQVTVHLDGQLYSLSDAYGSLQINYFFGYAQNTLFTANQGAGGAGTYDTIDQTFNLPLYTIAAHSSVTWDVELSATLGVYSSAGTTYLAGLPQGSVDASNTLSLTQVLAYDMSGNLLPSSTLTSADGFTNSVATAPEPSTTALFTGALIAMFLARRLRKARGNA